MTKGSDVGEADILFAVQRTLRGDVGAFTLIVRSYTAMIYSLARNYGRSPEDAEEDVQEIFLTAYRSLGRFEISRRFQPWLYGIALNHLRSVRRKNARRILRAQVLTADQQILDDTIGSSAPGPEQEVLERLADEDVRRALSMLPDNQRDAFVLRQMQGLPGPEAAQVLGIPEATLRTHLHRARKAVLRFLTNRGWE